MILQRANFNVPARFSFQPYTAIWDLETAETVEWAEDPTLLRKIFTPADERPEKSWLRVRVGVAVYGGLEMLYGFGDRPSYVVLMDRASIPPDVLSAHANHRNTPDIAGHQFPVLICRKPEFIDSLWALKPGQVTKNAWIMRDEFLNLDTENDWELNLLRFLNKWGMWDSGRGFSEDWALRPLTLLPPSAPPGVQESDRPDFVLVTPHSLKGQRDKYRRARLQSNARSWLRSHPLSLETGDEFPFFRVRSSYCRAAIEATITIDHLSGVKAGICKWCHGVFEKEKNYRMSFCGRSCANAASVARFRERQRKPEWTDAKIAKLLSQKGAKRNAKS